MSALSAIKPAKRAAAITKSDTVSIPPFRAIYVGGTGDIVVVFGDDTTCTFVGVPAGSVLPVSGKRVNSTSTTATSMVALY